MDKLTDQEIIELMNSHYDSYTKYWFELTKRRKNKKKSQ